VNKLHVILVIVVVCNNYDIDLVMLVFGYRFIISFGIIFAIVSLDCGYFVRFSEGRLRDLLCL
jgi:hypothetical protein